MDLEHLKVLENKIGKFLDKHEQVRRENEALAIRLKERDQQVNELGGQVKQLEHEKREVRSRLEKILGRLEGLDLP